MSRCVFRLLLFLGVLLSAGESSYSQVPWLFEKSVSEDRLMSDSALSVSCDGHFFFKNDEYFADYEEGYTLVGYTLRPLVKIGVGGKVTLAGGLQALMYGGTDKFEDVWPFFSAGVKFNEYVHLIVGCLPGPASHGMHEAIMNPEYQYTERPEMGLQVYGKAGRFSGHGWVNWRQYIFLGDTIPEKFSAGVVGKVDVVESASAGFEVPFCLVFDHIGGQISDYPDTLQSLCNVSISPTVWVKNPGGRFVESVGFKMHVLGFHSMAGSDVRPFGDGWAVNPEVCLRAKMLSAEVSWYRSHDYWAIHGTPLLTSLSNYKPEVYTSSRSLVNFCAAFNYSVTGVDRFSLEFRGYYDTFEARFDYSYGLCLVLNLDRDIRLPKRR